MATSAHHPIQDRNLNILYNGVPPGGKTDVPKADKKGGVGGRKALNDISNSRKPSVHHSAKKVTSLHVISTEKDAPSAKVKLTKAPEKGKVGGRKALGDLTNSVKPMSQQVASMSRKLNAVAEENIPNCMAEERFLHSHQKCIAAQMKPGDKDYFLKSVGLNNDIPTQPSAGRELPFSSKKLESGTKYLKVEDMPERLLEEGQVPQSWNSELSGYFSPPICRSPQSPKAPYMSWEEDDFSDFKVIGTP